VHARVRLIQHMDLPSLVEIGTTHHDPAYRTAVGAFTRDLVALAADLPLSAAAGTAARW